MKGATRTLWPLAATAATLALACGDTAGTIGSPTDAECCTEEPTPAPAPLPGASVWQITSQWTDRHGETRGLADLRGEVVVAAMIFTHCRYACPTLLSDMEAIRKELPEASARYLLVSMDTERDTPEVLDVWAQDNGLDQRWTLLHGDANAVRELAAVLGVNYSRAPSGDFAHSNLITVLDKDGRIVHQQRGLQADNAATVRVIRELMDD